MNILYTTNELFTGKVATSICSVFENNKDLEEINVYIIGQNLSSESCNRFAKMERKYKRKIQILPLNDLSEYFAFSFDTNGWNPIILARLLLDRLLPTTVNKILYLDGDTVNIAPLKDLYNMDLSNFVLGGVIEATISMKYRTNLGLEKYPYINAGVLLINLEKWREEKWGEKCIHYYKKKNGKLFANDQDIINVVLKDNIYYLPPKYNFYNIYWFYPYKMLKKLMKNATYYSPTIYQESIKNPAIIHYLGEERPWRKGNTHKFKKEYIKYHTMTPWKHESEEEGFELYFLCWRIFNVITKPVPMLRYKIITTLIPLFMKWRKKQLKIQRKKNI